MKTYGAQLASSAAAAALLVFGGGQSAHASGFQVMEQSATAQAYSFAGATAAAEDISYMYFNPAAIAFHPGFQSSFNGALILPNAEVSNAEGSTVLGSPISGGDDAADDFALIPSTYFSAQINEQFTAGLSITAPFGLVTDYDDDWVGRYHGTRSELLTINVSPTLAFRPIPQVALAAGFVLEYVDASLGNAVDLGTAGVANPSIGAAYTAVGATPTPGGDDLNAEVQGDDFEIGFTLGAIVEPVKGTRLGIAYRSEIEHKVDLDSYFSGTNATSSAVLAALRGGGVFTGSDASTSVSAPAQLNLGFYQELTDDFALVGDARWTQWSSFDELVIEFDDGTPDSVTEEKWDDTWFLALGGRYQATEALILRAGVAYDMGAAPDEFRTPRIPDADRFWVSFGGSYALSDTMSINAGYSYVSVVDETLNLSATGDNAGRGSLTADTESDVHIFAVGATARF